MSTSLQKISRLLVIAAAITMLTAEIADAAFAGHPKHYKHNSHSRNAGSLSDEVSNTAISLLATPMRLEVMRYYGGPKSPMWRGPINN